MSSNTALSEKWIKASIIGTIWAASEIVLGSFLHNLKVPFSGNILTSIGLIILISISYIWIEKGLFWRAGLICAVMKTMSPSAVIFGPMIAIFSESLLLEISVRLLGKTLAGFMLGAMLAMSWNLFYKILNYIVSYGLNIVQLYSDLLKYAQKQLGFQFDIVWLPIIILLAIYCLLGLLSAIIGIKVGRKLLRQTGTGYPQKPINYIPDEQNNKNTDFNYSFIWLLVNIILIVGSLVLLNYSLILWIPSIITIVTIWTFRYKRAFRQLSRPKFWVFFVIITMATAFVFSQLQADSISIKQALVIGIQMNFRAAIIIVGFSVLGTELYNPKIRQFFLKTALKQLPFALELSFKSLPSIIATIPDFKTIIKSPVSVIYEVISQAELRLAEIKTIYFQKVSIITGAIGDGKTSKLQKIAELLRARNISVGGICSPRIVENGVTIGYNVVNLLNNYKEIFLRRADNSDLIKIGKYGIIPAGLDFGKNVLFSSHNCEVIIIDEVGLLEIENGGWAGNIQNLLEAKNSHIILSVRDRFVEQVIARWNLKDCTVYRVSEMDPSAICDLITDRIRCEINPV